MRAGQVLQTLLADCWAGLDKRLVRRLLGGIEAMIAGRQVVLMERARQYPGATHARAPLKALDRLLSNGRAKGLRQKVYPSALGRFWSMCPTVIVVDWCSLRRDESRQRCRWGDGRCRCGTRSTHSAIWATLACTSASCRGCRRCCLASSGPS